MKARFDDFRFPAYAVGVLALSTATWNAFPSVVDTRLLLATCGSVAALLWAAFARVHALSAGRLPDRERTAVRDIASLAGAALIAILMWQLLPVPVVAVGWALLGVVLLDLGVTLSISSLRDYGHTAMVLMLARLLLANLTSDHVTWGISHRVLTMVPLTGLMYFISAWLKGLEQMEPPKLRERFSRPYLYAGTVLAVLIIAFELGRTQSTAGWALLALALVAVGLRRKNTDLRYQGHLVAMLAFVRSFVTDFYTPESLLGTPSRFITAGIVIGSFYIGQFLTPESSASDPQPAGFAATIERRAHAMFSVMATVLLATLIFNEMSAGLLTIAWSIQGAALLVLGFVMADRIFRRSGLLLLAICTTKAFAYDFRVLDTMSRILSFIVLGMLLLITSWAYTRYGERLRRYL